MTVFDVGLSSIHFYVQRWLPVADVIGVISRHDDFKQED